MPRFVKMIVTRVSRAVVALGMLAAAAPPVAAQYLRGDQDAVRRARQQGRILPLPEIERRVIPQMRGSQYLGFDFDPGSVVYTLKFLRDGAVIWVMVDGRSGTIVGRSDR